MEVTHIPLPAKARSADSRPAPTPFIITLTSFIPKTVAFSASSSPTLLAAKGVPFFAPLKPSEPEDDHARPLPFSSARRTLVLLYVDWICNTPFEKRLRAVLETVLAASAPSASLPSVVTIRFLPIYYL